MVETISLEGKAISDGIAMGRVCLYREDVLEAVAKYKISATDVAAEVGRFNNALAATKTELSDIYQRVLRALSSVEAEVFNAHIMILEDVAFVGEIMRRISDDLVNAESALLSTLKGYEEKFKVLPNHYFRDRIQDVNDISRRIVRNLGLKHEGFMCAACHGTPAVVATDDLTPSLVANLYSKQVAAIVAERGSTISHAAILAKAMGIPVVINIDNLVASLGCGATVIVDGFAGRVYINPGAELTADYELKQKKLRAGAERLMRPFARTKDGVTVNFFANAGSSHDIEHAKAHLINDIGLFRTEFLFMEREDEPSVDEQAKIYGDIITAAAGTVTFRLLDIGGDKIVSFLPLPQQRNPELGLRGARIYELYPGLISRQIEALLRAKGKRPVNILIPMVSTVKEFTDVRKIIFDTLSRLKKDGLADPAGLKVGCMIEVPSAVYLLHYLAVEADFLSIGTNDLIQYVMGVDRNNERLAELSSPFQPAIIKILSEIAHNAAGLDKEIVVCGELASDPEMAKVLAGLGFRNLSINVHNVEKIGAAISAHTIKELETLARSLLEMKSLEHVLKVFEP